MNKGQRRTVEVRENCKIMYISELDEKALFREQVI